MKASFVKYFNEHINKNINISIPPIDFYFKHKKNHFHMYKSSKWYCLGEHFIVYVYKIDNQKNALAW